MDLKLTGDTALVVGGASGIGLAIARAFAREGSNVLLWDRSAETPARAAELATESSTTCLGQIVDATDFVQVKKTAAEINASFGQIQHVVYAAGMGSGKFGFPFWKLEPSDWDRVLRVNLLGAVNVAHALAPGMAERQQGTFLFISSVAGQIGSQTDPPYSAAKAGLINFAQAAAKDLAPHNVRVNTICPGMIQTPLNRAVWQAWNDQQPADAKRAYDDWAGEKVRSVIPLKRWQTPDDIAAYAVFLASYQAQNITGQTLNVDGGWVMHW
ncbi:3-oxoacyl-[acyl-carrier-protein] reductase FabG [Anatilimnocola aggregata]|uniref:3-oxoacyl-[acyl-carrier-protein] reductase FabG n=1 Tax=Anatilimnocola aggregata TaxID=2528021 RepID=A0A517YEU0_9BACT|nr:SDR family NAD(P)-dependent oxidoreductase [Anatilimnocola aggregata]QDU28754.1 3-oxoacyl-[acyl-carrier-protein] reductase FabG [Anatilimnocola aggregata]